MLKQGARAAYLRMGLPVLRRLPFPSTVVGPVRKKHDSLPAWIEESQGRDETPSAHVVRHQEARVLRSPEPLAAIPRLPQNLAENRLHTAPDSYLACLHDARIATRWFEIISPDDGIFQDLYYPNSVTGRRSIRSLVIPRLPGLQERSGTYAAILTKGAGNYYHWLNDCLTRLWLLRHEEALYKLIVPDNLLGFQRQSLEILGYRAKCLAPFGNEHWKVERLLVPSLTNAESHSNPEACRWLAKRLIEKNEVEDGHWPERIYVSRRHAGKRRLLNEIEIERLLAQHGFETVFTERMSFGEQIRMFQNSQVVVAPHGAGLTNILFMKEGRLVIELLPSRRAKTCYYSMAAALGLRYACVTDAPERPARGSSGQPADTDFSIIPGRLERTLDSLASVLSGNDGASTRLVH